MFKLNTIKFSDLRLWKQINIKPNCMDKYYSKEISDKELENAEMSYTAEPSEAAVKFILNYSKSLSVKKSESVGSIFLNLN